MVQSCLAMILDRQQQTLLLNGKRLTPDEISATDITKLDSPLRELYDFLQRWFNNSPFITVHTSGSTGKPKALEVEKDRMMQSARLTCDFLGLKEGDSALLCMNLKYIGAMMVVVRSLVYGLNLSVISASGHPLKYIDQPLKFVAMVPLQVYNSLQEPQERERLNHIEQLIIGGGAIDDTLLAAISQLQGQIYSTYGMTETLSHIALRPLNGRNASKHYIPFPSVKLSLDTDGTLIIDAPLICRKPLHTNDIAQLFTDGSFVILGRKDNIINSGGIKIQLEEDERELKSIISVPFALTAIPDERLGEALVLLIQASEEINISQLERDIKQRLPRYHHPRKIMTIEHLPLAGNGKIDRKTCKAWAMQHR